MDCIRYIPQAGTPALPCQALRKYETWTVYVTFRRRGRLRSHVRLCGNMKHGRYTLHSAGETPALPCQALRKYEAWTVYAAFRRRGRLRSHVWRCGNMKHGLYTLHSAGEDACAPMSGFAEI